MNFSISSEEETKSYRSSVTFHQGAVTRKTIAEGYLEKNSASFLSADLMANNTANDLAELIKRKKKDVVLERLVKFDERINAIETIGNEIFIGFEGMGELLPIGMTGDGLRRYLSIVASSANTTNNIILIDEIDNGLHYSAYKKLWESIFALATDTNKQVFITTHSQETLYQLYQMLEENPQYQDAFRLYTIEQTLKKDHQAYKYTYEAFKDACLNEVELRSIIL
jgi:predicted ATPase